MLDTLFFEDFIDSMEECDPIHDPKYGGIFSLLES